MTDLPNELDDPDALREPPAPRPVHLRPALLLLVAAGGAVGTAGREGLVLAVPPLGDLPLAVLIANLLGAFVLGLLLERLVRAGPDVGRRRLVRLGAGTGFCGGFTTYSSLATATAVLLTTSGAAALGVAYVVGTVVLGALTTWAGIAVGARR